MDVISIRRNGRCYGSRGVGFDSVAIIFSYRRDMDSVVYLPAGLSPSDESGLRLGLLYAVRRFLGILLFRYSGLSLVLEIDFSNASMFNLDSAWCCRLGLF